ncbi:hypothetical protein J3458_020850 [Metarhizium acridum]|uniref:uncharacterized protein n=1 Tax=Metarhizium acridum TaxID=92637 RepID=UPI001C6B0E30|nr:hypothetical protein J3458_020850 [Metarhizium acridum]
MLVSRPFLVSRLTSAENNASYASGTFSTHAEDPRPDEQLESIALDSAIYMSETISNAAKISTVFFNACFIKTRLFSAALVLAISMIVGPSVSFKAQPAFNLAKESFYLQSGSSLYSAQYHQILEDIAAIIKSSHATAAQNQSKTNQRYVGHLLKFSSTEMCQDAAQSVTLNSDALETLDMPSIDDNLNMFLSIGDEGITNQLGSLVNCDVDSFWYDLARQ